MQSPCLHVLRDQALSPENMEGKTLFRGSKVLVQDFVGLKLIQMIVSSSILDPASIFRKDWWREAFESGYVLKQLCRSQLISPGVHSRNTVLLRDAAVRPEPGQEAVLQVNGCLSHLLISGEGVVVIDRDLQVFLLR